MTKQEAQQRVLQNGKPLPLDKFEWDEKTKTFSSNEDNLVLDFTDIDSVTFNTGYGCTFKTGSDCTFNTGFDCTFKTGSDCTFNTGFDCTFKTEEDCVVVGRDVYEVIELNGLGKIKLNGYNEKGYTRLDKESEVEVTVEGKTITISRKSAKALGLLKD